jgi:hypothetical protein
MHNFRSSWAFRVALLLLALALPWLIIRARHPAQARVAAPAPGGAGGESLPETQIVTHPPAARLPDSTALPEVNGELAGVPHMETAVSAPIALPKPPARAGGEPEPLLVAKQEQPIPHKGEILGRPPGGAPGKMPGAEPALRLQELLQEAADNPDPRQAQRTLLTVAGYHVGNRDWPAAKEIYDRLKASPYPEIAFAVARNLDVVNRNQAILAEPDAGRREWQELDLAAVHQMYGHEKAAKTMLRSLEKAATQEEVRRQAAQRLATYVSPPVSAIPGTPTEPPK